MGFHIKNDMCGRFDFIMVETQCGMVEMQCAMVETQCIASLPLFFIPRMKTNYRLSNK